MKWISVEDRLPESGEVLVYCGSRGKKNWIETASYSAKWREWSAGTDGYLMMKIVLYWMPLPSPPINNEILSKGLKEGYYE